MKLNIKSLLVVIAMIVGPCLSAQAQLRGNEGANGGDDVALEFHQAFSSALAQIQAKLPAMYSKAESVQLQRVLDQATVMVVETPLLVEKDGVYQDSIATNTPDKNLILINRSRWQQIVKNEIKEALALHEVASLAGLESTGEYGFSREFLGLYNFTIDPDYDFSPICGRLENQLYLRSLALFEVGEGTYYEVRKAAIALHQQLRYCGVMKKPEFCRATVPFANDLLQGTAELLQHGYITIWEKMSVDSEMTQIKNYCESDETI